MCVDCLRYCGAALESLPRTGERGYEVISLPPLGFHLAQTLYTSLFLFFFTFLSLSVLKHKTSKHVIKRGAVTYLTLTVANLRVVDGTMGGVFASLSFNRKRCRDADGTGERESASLCSSLTCPRVFDNDDVAAVAYTVEAQPSMRAKHLRHLRYRCCSTEKIDTVVCRYVAEDTATQLGYGCHAHLYETSTADESHGVALAWCVEETAPLSTLSLLSLCRVANSCRKKTLLTSLHGEALILTYTATI
jgi:hypothetical protein